jgi:hypothetical protein
VNGIWLWRPWVRVLSQRRGRTTLAFGLCDFLNLSIKIVWIEKHPRLVSHYFKYRRWKMH